MVIDNHYIYSAGSGPKFGSMSSQVHQAHIALNGPMTSIVQQGSNLGLYSIFPFPTPTIIQASGHLTLCQVLSGGRQNQKYTFRQRQSVGEKGNPYILWSENSDKGLSSSSCQKRTAPDLHESRYLDSSQQTT